MAAVSEPHPAKCAERCATECTPQLAVFYVGREPTQLGKLRLDASVAIIPVILYAFSIDRARHRPKARCFPGSPNRLTASGFGRMKSSETGMEGAVNRVAANENAY